MATKKKVIVIAGPTAAGKTAVAIDVAKHFDTEIISADSRQCYKELNIGVARPSPSELAQVPHHFIASHSINDKINAGIFEQYALKKAEEIFKHKDVMVMVGGTGLYINAFCNGIDEIPEIPEVIRKGIVTDYNNFGLPWLQHAVKEKDPLFFAHGETQNPHRLMRALEVYIATGKSINDFKKGIKSVRSFEIIKIILGINKELLHYNIENRVERMMEQGLLNEVKSLYHHHNLSALNTVGYKELFAFMDGEIALDKAKELIITHTKQYAKRQLTWFKKDISYNWHSDQVEILNYLKNHFG